MYEAELTESYFPAQGGEPDQLMTVGEMLRRSAERYPDTIALKELLDDGSIGRVWTYAEFLRDAQRVGRALSTRHAGGARVTVYAGNLPEWLLLEYGCALAGNPRPLDPAQIQYTSGTTGFPKGAVLHHQGLVQNAYDGLSRIGIEPGDVVMHHMPLFHCMGCAILGLGSFSLGATIVLARMFEPDLVVRRSIRSGCASSSVCRR